MRLGLQQKVGKWQVCKWFDRTELVELPEIKNHPKKKPRETLLESSRKKYGHQSQLQSEPRDSLIFRVQSVICSI